MDKEEAWRIIEECRNWNAGQKSVSAAFGGPRTPQDDALDARRLALSKAWRIVADG